MGNRKEMDGTQRTSKALSLVERYPLLCAIVLFPLQGFCDMFQCPYHASNHKTIYTCKILEEHAQMFGYLKNSYTKKCLF